MRRHTLGVLGLVLVVLGICGVLVTGALVVASVVDSDRWLDSGTDDEDGGGGDTPGFFDRFDGSFDSPGERIFYTGEGTDGDRISRSGGFGMMSSGGCVTCHGTDGQGGAFGGMMGGRLNVPDIRYSTLSEPHEEDGEQQDGWSDEDIARAVREGEEPDGDELSRYMPRWDMSDDDMDALIDYLKELD